MQSSLRTMYRPFCGVATATLLWIHLSAGAFGQPEIARATSAALPVIPQQMQYTGSAANRAGDTVEAVFRIYAVAEGGEPLWSETQRVTIDANGAYHVVLGSATQGGLPQTLFAGGAARWLGVSIERAEELPRSPLSSVAYAMKAGDAQTVGGIAARRFVTQEQLAAMAKTVAAQTAQTIVPDATPSGSGTTNYIPLWTSSSNLGNSKLYQSGNNVGIGTAAPVSPFQVSTPYSPVTANATNYINEVAIRTLTLPIASGVTDAGSRAGVQISNYSTDPNFLGTLAAQFGLWARVGDISGAGAGTITNSYGVYIDNLTGGSSTIKNSYGLYQNSTAAKNYFGGKVGIGTRTPAANLEVNGTAKFDGLITFAQGQTFPGTGPGTITGITTSSPLTGSGTSGSVALGLNTSALETTLNAVYARLGAADTFTQEANFNNTAQAFGSAGNPALLGWGSNGSIGTFGDSDTGFGVEGESHYGEGVYGFTSAPAPGSAGVLGGTGNSFSASYSSEVPYVYASVWADTSSNGTSGSPVALFATADEAYGIASVTDSVFYPGLYVYNAGGNGGGITAGSGDGLIVIANGSGNGVQALAASPSVHDAGVLGVATSKSATQGTFYLYSGVWGDTGVSYSSRGAAPVGVIGTADDAYAGLFYNNSNASPTLYVYNQGNGGIGSAGTGNPLFSTFMAGSNQGTCGIGGGSLSCTGQIKSLVPTGGGARTVETYAVQSPENWIEDFGSGELHNGVAVVSIDPAFGDTISGDSSYHVFLTPKGDCKGLYVTAESGAGFEVRELGGGASSVSFDYRIVGKRRGFEAQRLNDVTETLAAEQKRAQLPKADPARKAPARQPSPLELAFKQPHRTIVPPPSPRDARRIAAAAPATSQTPHK